MKTTFSAVLIILFSSLTRLSAQYVNIPSETWGIGFGNSPKFTGIRFNFADKNIEKLDGINVTIWSPKDFDSETGSINGISLGLPMAVGTGSRNGINLGVFGVGAAEKLVGINIGLLGIGAGEDVVGLNIGGLGGGAGENLTGINLGGLGIGAGNKLSGINIGGLGVGAGGSVSGISASIIAVGSGESITGINIAGIAVGSRVDVTGINLAGIAIGSGESVKGINFGGIAVGSGSKVVGINLSIIAVAAPTVKGLSTALVVSGEKVHGIAVAPAYFRIEGNEGYLKGISISAVNHIRGTQNGLSIGIFNYTWEIAGFQLGILNYVKSNPRGLKILPVFNTRF
ncbi:hypothetical protein ACFLU5_08475 [Bacteroidota bacterium]